MNVIKKNILSFSPSRHVRAGKGLRHGATLLAVLAGLLSGCSEWDDHYDNTQVEGNNVTLWQEMAARPELSDFVEVLNSTKVFRQHKKTSVSYGDLLNGGQTYTVFAPVNGTFNKDSLIALTETAEGDSAVERCFVKNHLASTLRSAADTTTTFRLLNGKFITMKSDNAGDVSFEDSNVRTKNGVMHVMQSQLPYMLTIYETMTQVPEFSSVGDVVKKYNKDVFDENASISSGYVDGVPVYVDSVVYETNDLMSSVGLFNDEDSTYYVAIPSNNGWQKAWEKVTGHFKYAANVEKGDSLQHYYASRAIFDYAVFSKTIQPDMNARIRNYRYDAQYPEYHVFFRPFDSDGLFGKAQGVKKCSNGYFYYYDEWPFTPQQTYFRKIEQEGENTWNITSNNGCSFAATSIDADSVSKGAYLYVRPQVANWTLTYKLSNTLSGKYDICVVTLPHTIIQKNSKKRYKFTTSVQYVDANGKAQTYNCNGGTAFESEDYARIDTIVVAKAFEFPTCNYAQDNNNVTITIKQSARASGADNTKFVREMLLDCIFLRPTDN